LIILTQAEYNTVANKARDYDTLIESVIKACERCRDIDCQMPFNAYDMSTMILELRNENKELKRQIFALEMHLDEVKQCKNQS